MNIDTLSLYMFNWSRSELYGFMRLQKPQYVTSENLITSHICEGTPFIAQCFPGKNQPRNDDILRKLGDSGSLDEVMKDLENDSKPAYLRFAESLRQHDGNDNSCNLADLHSASVPFPRRQELYNTIRRLFASENHLDDDDGFARTAGRRSTAGRFSARQWTPFVLACGKVFDEILNERQQTFSSLLKAAARCPAFKTE